MSNVELTIFSRRGNILSVQCTGDGSENATKPEVRKALQSILQQNGFKVVDSNPVVVDLTLRNNIKPETPFAKMAAAIQGVDPGCRVQLPR